MEQLTQKLKDGTMQAIEVPVPTLREGCILVRNFYSLISAGTETSTVKAARKGLIGKAKERPQQVKQVVDSLKTQGFKQTYRAVMKKLETYSPLGYSCVGEVVDVAPGINEFAVNDFVAMGGFTASHADYVCVPVNLCVKLPKDIDLKQAAYNTIGAIAMQGIRQADIRLGETCAIIGLGLLGQLTVQLAKASGAKVIGIDINQEIVDIARDHNTDLALNRNDAGIDDIIYQFTNKIGCDAVIITAATQSLDPVNFAGAISKKRGTIVIVGDVPTGFSREPYFYKKELQVKMSCSYGPGRYDPIYEEKGIDYPAAYVRWTEKRNMQAFQELIYTKSIDINYLTTHVFKLKEAKKAYDMLVDGSEKFIGVLLEYDAPKEIKRKLTSGSATASISAKDKYDHIAIGFVGAGSYAQSHLLPNIPKKEDISLEGVLTTSGVSSRSVSDKFGFKYCTSDEDDIFNDDTINTVFITTRHNSHAHYVVKALEHGKRVFVEKPLCMTLDELKTIKKVKQDDNLLMVGYNRRYAKLIQKIKSTFQSGPFAINYRINAGNIPDDSWIQDLEVGGGRIIGEVCHFVDLLTYLCGSLPIKVYANVMQDVSQNFDTVNISLTHANGSIGNISYFANGSKIVSKEIIEIFANGCIAQLNDFKTLTIYSNNQRKKTNLMAQDKGQKAQMNKFVDAVHHGQNELISFDEICNTSVVTFKIIESIRVGKALDID